MKNLIDFDEEAIQPSKAKPDLIPTSKTRPKPPTSKAKPDLIPTSKTKPKPPTSKAKPDLIPTSKPKKIDELMEKNLIDFNQSPYERYTITTIYYYPLTKDILGLKLTNNLKEKISKLNTESAIGLTWIIRSLVLTNKGKAPVYNYSNLFFQLSKTQIKEIIEYYFTTLAILLNPAQKTGSGIWATSAKIGYKLGKDPKYKRMGVKGATGHYKSHARPWGT